jgi:hypothetical protein
MWTDEAITSYNTILTYLQEHFSKIEIRNFIGETEHKLSLISSNPKMYRKSSKYKDSTLRLYREEQYLSTRFVCASNV